MILKVLGTDGKQYQFDICKTIGSKYTVVFYGKDTSHYECLIESIKDDFYMVLYENNYTDSRKVKIINWRVE